MEKALMVYFLNDISEDIETAKDEIWKDLPKEGKRGGGCIPKTAPTLRPLNDVLKKLETLKYNIQNGQE